jgi:hypothetical protein
MGDAESRLGIELIVHIADEEQIRRLDFDGREGGHALSHTIPELRRSMTGDFCSNLPRLSDCLVNTIHAEIHRGYTQQLVGIIAAFGVLTAALLITTKRVEPA